MAGKTEITIKAYNKNAEKYMSKFMDFKPYRDMISEFQKSFVKDNDEILDIGCGPGNNAKLLYDMNTSCKITGIDLSDEMIKHAGINAPNCRFIKGDLRNLSFAEEFDIVIASFCIVHLSDLERDILISAISSSLKPGGYLYLSFMEGKEPGFETTSFSKDPIFFNYHDRKVVGKVLESSGIEILKEMESPYEESDGSITTDVFIFAGKIWD